MITYLKEYKHGFEWAGIRTEFESDVEFTVAKDLVFETPPFLIKTRTVNEVMRSRLTFMSSLNKSEVLGIIKAGFARIVQDKHGYLSNKERGWYEVVVKNIAVFFVLYRQGF